MRLPKREDVRSVFVLAAPIAVMQMGMILYGLVDTFFLGRVSPTAIAGVAVGHAAFSTLIVTGLGILLGIDTLSSQAYGAGKPADCAAILLHACALALLTAFPMVLVCGLGDVFFRWMGVDAAVASTGVEYLNILRWMTIPHLLFVACRQYLQSMGITKPLIAGIVLGNCLNVFLNYVLIFGRFGFPAMGVRGCALASVVSSCLMLACAAAASVVEARRSEFKFRGWQGGVFFDLVRLGVPCGLHHFVEVSVFALVTVLMGRFGSVPTAAHQITFQMVVLMFMVTLGTSYAAAVRVGQGIGRKDPDGAVRSGDSAVLLSAAFMACAAVVFVVFPGHLIRLFSNEAAVLSLGVPFLYIAALFQIFDGTQITVTGALRGMGITRIPLYANLVGHGCVGVPLGYGLAFHTEVGPRGLWIGLLAGLICVSVTLYVMWRKRADALVRASAAQSW